MTVSPLATKHAQPMDLTPALDRESNATIDLPAPQVIARMSDTEFSDCFADLIGAQQAWINARRSEGAEFLRSRGKTVHTVDCRAGGFLLSDRLQAWATRVPTMDLREIRRHLQAGMQPPMPEMLDRVDIALPGMTYRRCRVCAPDVPDIESPAARGSHTSVVAFLRHLAQKYQDRPSIALLTILELHECTMAGTCSECHAAYPCHTIESVNIAYDMPSSR